ncbi:aminotransferase class V-fold PLP-dependent enzyme [Ruminococcus sp. NK3A76]|uniref:aminotransferase class V-fold PLP-dependent enzyme n=1 Tax=Ruminococcus sp. NK3A76 TaxID=877411 RepID=UPI00049155A2|nr:aminotransferase class V-fold PLP-dependent enzyme [Ruminococcus sp. NK3A76]
MINFDNSATTYPKPQSVRNAVALAVERFGGNPGRSGHEISKAAAVQVYNVREKAAKLFGAEVENVAFTQNCTYALNMAIKGLLQYGGHTVISSLEHNSASRPVYNLYKTRDVSYSIARIEADDDRTIDNFRRLINKDTKCLICTAASNVTGQITPYKHLAELAHEHGIAFVCDCAQASGVLGVTLADGMDFICTSGHKGLYGPAGTGLLITNGEFPLSTIIEGGTGATSAELLQTDVMPEKLESGTVNTVGIMGLGKGIDFVNYKTQQRIKAHESALCEQLLSALKRHKSITVYRSEGASYAPIVAFNIGEYSSEQVTEYLNSRGFALRGGLQCSALAHHSLGTLLTGVVRFSPSAFNDRRQVNMLINEIDRIASGKAI